LLHEDPSTYGGYIWENFKINETNGPRIWDNRLN
jgi:hypothetical protein